ncbi:class I SAM-dependent methyltransferase [Humidesulfovibrio sp.]
MRSRHQRSLGELPFVWDALARCTDAAALPEKMPFTLGVDQSTGALVHIADEPIRAALQQAYLFGSVITGVETPDTEDSNSYAEAFWSFLTEMIGAQLAGGRFLEIGSGHGALLTRLHAAGAKVVGLEPGEHGQEFSAASGIPVVRGFFPCPKIEGKFDVILSCHVLEHIEDVTPFFDGVKALLVPGGRFVLAVPDCTPYVDAGDPSMLIHEHFYYHTKDSLERMLREQGMRDIEVREAAFGGSLYASCRSAAEGLAANEERPAVDDRAILEAFSTAYDKNVSRLVAFLKESLGRGEQVGCYSPFRALNVLALAGVSGEGVRFFDDDPCLHGKKLVGFPALVESRDQLLAMPPRYLVIMSYTFGEKLRNELAPLLPEGTTLLTWQNFFGKAGQE